MADEQTKKSYEQYLKGLLEDLETSIAYQKADADEKNVLLTKLTGENYEDREDLLDERFIEYRDYLEVNTYIEQGGDGKKIDVLSFGGGPNIRLRLESRRDSAELNYYRGGEHYTYRFFTRAEIDMLFSLFDISY